MSDEVLNGEVVELHTLPSGLTMRKAGRGGAGPRLVSFEGVPWERQPGETARQFAKFNAFLRLPAQTRTIRELARQTGRSLGLLGTLASRFRWIERAELWDEHMQRLQLAADEQARVEMAERHAQIAMGLQQRALTRLQQLQPEALDAKDVARFLEVATRLERLARGEPTEIERSETTHRVAAPLSDDELDAFERGA